MTAAAVIGFVIDPHSSHPSWAGRNPPGPLSVAELPANDFALQPRPHLARSQERSRPLLAAPQPRGLHCVQATSVVTLRKEAT
jgi:hypothetical protein